MGDRWRPTQLRPVYSQTFATAPMMCPASTLHRARGPRTPCLTYSQTSASAHAVQCFSALLGGYRDVQTFAIALMMCTESTLHRARGPRTPCLTYSQTSASAHAVQCVSALLGGYRDVTRVLRRVASTSWANWTV